MAGSAAEEKPRRKRNVKTKRTEEDDSEEETRKRQLRILKRKPTNADFHYRTDWLTCWSHGNQPVVVGPPKIEEQVRCILISPNAKWLKELCFEHKTWQHLENSYIARVVSKLKDTVRGFKLNPLDVGGAALRDDHSSQESVSETEATRPNRYRETPRWCRITVNDEGDSLQVVAKGGNGIFVEYTGEAIILICNLLHQARRSHESDSTPDHSSLLTPADEGRVTYSFTRKSFRVTYKLKTGRMLNKLFEVKNGNATMTLALAIMYWNQCGISDEERFVSGIL